MSDDRLQQLRSDISDRCVEIEDLFKVPVKVTVIVRDPENPNMEVVVTNDTFDGVRGAVNRAEARPELRAEGTVQ